VQELGAGHQFGEQSLEEYGPRRHDDRQNRKRIATAGRNGQQHAAVIRTRTQFAVFSAGYFCFEQQFIAGTGPQRIADGFRGRLRSGAKLSGW
jgi:hypothetical protein